MSLTQITNHVEIASGRLVSQHRGKTNIEAFLAAIIEEVQLLENVLFQLYLERQVDTAVGAQLDVIGKIVGRERDGLGDTDYRRVIKAQIATNSSDGDIERLLNIARLIINDPSATIHLRQEFPAAMFMELNDTITTDQIARLLMGNLLDAVGAGIRILLQYSTLAVNQMFHTAIMTFTTAALTGSETVIPVTSTTGFPTAGTVILGEGLPVEESVAYDGIQTNAFLLPSSPSNAHLSNATVALSGSPGIGLDDVTSPGTLGHVATVIDSTEAHPIPVLTVVNFLQAGRSADQTGLSAIDDVVEFDQIVRQIGTDVQLDTVTNVGRFTLEPGNYIFFCTLSVGNAVIGARREFILYDVTAAAEILGSRISVFNATAGTTAGGSQTMKAYLTPTVATEYEVRLQTAASIDISGPETSVTIVRIS